MEISISQMTLYQNSRAWSPRERTVVRSTAPFASNGDYFGPYPDANANAGQVRWCVAFSVPVPCSALTLTLTNFRAFGCGSGGHDFLAAIGMEEGLNIPAIEDSTVFNVQAADSDEIVPSITVTVEQALEPGTTYYLWLTGSTRSDSATEGAHKLAFYTENAPAYSLDATPKGLVYIDSGAGFEPYTVHIDNGAAWEQYVPYVDNGTAWDMYS